MVLEKFRNGFGDDFGTQNRSKIYWKIDWIFYWFFKWFWDRFWKDFGSLLAPIGEPKSSPGLIQAALGARGASPRAPKSLRSPPRLPKIDPEGSQSSQNGALETPRAPTMNPWTLTEPPKSAPGSHPRLAEDPKVTKIDPRWVQS